MLYVTIAHLQIHTMPALGSVLFVNNEDWTTNSPAFIVLVTSFEIPIQPESKNQEENSSRYWLVYFISICLVLHTHNMEQARALS